MADNDSTAKAADPQEQQPHQHPRLPHPTSIDDTDNASVGSTASSKAEERRRRRETWMKEHEKQIKVDGTFPRRNSTRLGGESLNKTAVSARVVQHLGTKSTAKPHTLPPTVSDSVRVRSNLLRTLGIQQEPAVVDDGKIGGGALGAKPRSHRRIQSADGKSLLLGGGVDLGKIATPAAAASGLVSQPPPNRSLLSVVRLKEELKYDSDDDVDPYPGNINRFFGGRQSSSLDNKGVVKIPRRRRLVFSDDVEVVPIPMRSEYSNRIKERMYSNRVELSENAQRNVVEFEAEGWDASTVLDDENQFYKCPLTGELIHPVHLAYFSKAGGDSKEDQR